MRTECLEESSREKTVLSEMFVSTSYNLNEKKMVSDFPSQIKSNNSMT